VGHSADTGLVKDIVTRMNSRYDFVCDGVDLQMKGIPQLAAAMASLINNVTVQVSGTAFQQLVQNPIKPIIPENLSTILIHCESLQKGASVLVMGNQNRCDAEYVTSPCSVCSDDPLITTVSKYADLIQFINLEQQLSRPRRSEAVREVQKRQAIMFRLLSGIRCHWTSCVGVVTRESLASPYRGIYI
jgi:hypothetical protein